ncbi:hypothetical protein L9F63_027135 [Diploptera punctata]|uniref:BZIP domain-containing protein n=1 Tax=Diploptera punctata TaxID=6984 RepID=A0AAD8AC21_DIPPU|nr:hypothetical protein L9F63_027135 [Diploptera punctata]
MADPVYSGDFFLESGFSVKQEPISMDTGNCTASMPIPARKMMDLSELRDFGFELLDVSSSPSTSNDVNTNTSTIQGNSSLFQIGNVWGTRLNSETDINRTDTFRMDDDDIFQVDKADLIQGPTLAELNANDENLLEDLNFDDLLLPEENSYFISVPSVSQRFGGNIPPLVQVTNTNVNVCNNNQNSTLFTPSSFPPASMGFYKETFSSSSVPSSPMDPFVKINNTLPSSEALSPTSQHSSSSSLLLHSAASSVTPPPMGVSPLQQKTQQLLGQSVPGTVSPMAMIAASPGPDTTQKIGRSTGCSSRLSSSAPTHLGLEQIWQRREPRQHLLSTGSLAEAGSTSSISTGGVLSPESHDFSHDEGFDSEDDSEHYEDFSSDAESVSDVETGSGKLSMTRKERFFWQYNVQAKGPKGQRLVLKTKLEDPHVLNEVTDPVFSPECSVRGIKHSGKARKGDGNDLTPNHANCVTLEKNKLASRACRLKKKAQHEANKLKLHGLEQEHRRLNAGILQIKQVLAAKFTTENQENQEELTKHIEKLVKNATKLKIAGHTTDFVNRVLERVKSGSPNGGLDEI